MDNTEKQEIIKALAYGKTPDQIKRAMDVTDADIASVTGEEIAAKRAVLRERGYIR